MCGNEDVPTARRLLSRGLSAREEGVKAIQVLEWGARFCWPRRRGGESRV